MPPRNPELPEGTDHIVNGALDTGGGTGGATGRAGTGAGFVGSASTDDTGGTAGGKGGSGDIKGQLRDGASNIQQQASGKIREYAETGKSRATSALDEFSQVVSDAAESIDERMGAEYGEYARRAADAVSDFADTLRNKPVDDLFNDGRDLVRKSPGVAVGVAAVVGFTLVRLIKSGFDSQQQSRGGEREIEFEPDMNTGRTGGTQGGAAAGATGSTVGGTAGAPGRTPGGTGV